MTCRITGLVGMHLSSLDRYLIMETCGQIFSPALVEELETLGPPELDGAASGVVISKQLQLPGGQYRLCWCSGEHFSCSSQESFRIDVGDLTVIGIAPLAQHRTCLSGRSCFLKEITGTGLSSDDVLFALETCGQDNASLARFPLSGKTSLEEQTSKGTSHTFGHFERISAAGGIYRLCWCHRMDVDVSDGVCAPRDAVIDIGSLTLIGPTSSHAHRTCISGATCSFPDFHQEEDGVDSTELFVMETCGVVESLVLGFGTEATSRFSDLQVISAAGGRYQLCWCGEVASRSSDCIAADAEVTFGHVTLIGLSPLTQDRTCVSGQTCSFELSAFAGDWDDSSSVDVLGSRVLILETCGLASLQEGLQANSWPLDGASTSGARATQIFQSNALMPAGNFRICWCSAWSSPCASASDFAMDVGQLTLIGPFPSWQDATCVSGQRCVGELRGVGLSAVLDSDDTLVVMDTCGFDGQRRQMQLQRTPQVALAPSHVQWQLDGWLLGGTYRLCWCGHGLGCSNSDFLDVGALTMIGPSPDQHRTCNSGEICSFQQLTGHALQAADLVALMDTCGVSMGHRFPELGQFLSSHGHESLGPTSLSAAGGRYRLCWCSSLYLSSCSTMEGFNVDAGELLVLGPRPLTKDMTCVSGQSCTLLDLTSSEMLPSSTISGIAALNTCGVPDPEHQASHAFPLLRPSDSSGTRLTWDVQVPGQYRLCWCSSEDSEGCRVIESFQVDIGALTVLGPYPLQVTCMSGQLCMAEIFGLGLKDDDDIFVLDTCSETETEKPGFLHSKLHKAEGFLPEAPEAPVVWELLTWNTITALGGEYRLCWCPRSSACIESGADRWNFGSLTVIGPSGQKTQHTCVSGQTCELDAIPGQYLAKVSKVTILETFGVVSVDHSYEERWNWTGRLVAPETLVGAGGMIVWDEKLKGPGGHGLSGSDAILLLETCGVETSIDRFTFGGADVSSSGARSSWERQIVAGPTFLANEPESRNHSAERRILEWEFISSAGGEYRLCWYSALCEGASEGSASCYSSGNGRGSLVDLVDFGRLQLLGPASLSLERTCMSGQSCHLGTITGLGLSDADRILVMETCGASSTIPNLPADGVILLTTRYSNWSASPSGLAMLNTAPWTDPVTAAAGRYRMCWCSSLGDCETGDDVPRVVDIGLFMLIGPTPLSQDRTCFSGQLCNFEVNGIGMDLGSSLLMLLHTCGSTSLVTDFETGHELSPFSLNQTHFEVRLLRKSAVEIPSGGYRLCWCAGEPFGCTSSIDFKTDIGSLHVVGPVRMQERTCISGQTCTIRDIMGVQLGDAISLLDTCGEESVIPRFPSFGHVQRNAGTATVSFPVVSAAGGSYQLCWCPKDFHCEVAEDFRVPLGQLLLLGPSPLTQARTCVSGSTCSVEPLEGSDVVYILETCGVSRSAQEEGALQWTVDVGEMFIIGPFSLRSQHRTCVTGKSCTVAGISGTLSAADHLLVFETCSESLVSGFSNPVSVATEGWLTVTWPNVTALPGQYRLCWCAEDPVLQLANASACNLLSSFRIDIGELSMTGVYGQDRGFLSTSCGALEEFHTDFGQLSIIGPTTPVQQTCVSGHTCIIDAPTGYLLSASDSFQVLETCGVPGFIPGFPSVPEVVSTRGSLSLAWDSTTITAYGGQYRICWCASGMTCSQAEAFQVDAGQLVLIGPRPLIQGRTCVGMPCNITGLSGIHLASTDLVMLLDTCGLPAFRSDPGGFSGTAVAVTFSGQGAQIEASSSSPSDHLKGGFYRLCWCAGGIATDPCASHANFQTDFGEVYVVGSSPFDQHRTCVSGQTCAWSGINLLPGSLTGQQLILLDTCALNGARALLPNGAIVPHVQIEESVGLAQLQASWGSDRLSGAGGTYRACWCDSNCPIAEGHFFLDVATISILGPNPLLQFDFMDTDFEVLTISGGEYRLCWCAAGFECSGADDFVIDVGTFTVVGIQCFEAGCVADRTCVSGQPCNVDGIQGVHLGPLDTIAILDTCGTATIPHLTGHWNDAPHAVRSVAWNTDYLTVGGGIYKLCWCAGLLECSQSEHFRVEAGSLTVVGPAPKEQHRTCIGGQQCVIEGFVVESPTTTDLAMVLQTCGSVGGSISSTVATLGASGSRVDFGNAFASASGGTYRSNTTAWSTVERSWCTRGEDFRVDVGTFTVIGPETSQRFTCLAGMPCELLVLGVGLASSDEYMILETCGINSRIKDHRIVRTCVSGERCRLPEMESQDLEGSELVILDTCGVASQVLHLPALSFDLGANGSLGSIGLGSITAAGGEYRICWCGSMGVSVTNSCQDAEHFRIDVGTLMLLGPALQQDRTCVSGQTCSMYITGHGLQSRPGSFAVLETCGVGVEWNPFAGRSVLSSATSPVDASTLRWTASSRLMLPGGDYRLCWCPYISNNSDAESVCLAEDFATDVGRFELIGLSPLQQDRTCISGQRCSFQFQGNHLSENDTLLVAETCGTVEVMRRFAENAGMAQSVTRSGAHVSFGPVTAAGGQFQLCWCSGSLGKVCNEDFSMTDRTCISGNTCTLENLTFHLSTPGDTLLVLETCGVSHLPQGLPQGPFLTSSFLSTYSVGFQDVDGDGLTYCGGDICYQDPAKIYPEICGCGVPDVDTDNDGTLDCLDWCPFDSNKTMPGHCGCGTSEDDTDGDGVLDCEDRCPLDPSKTNPELCGCGVSDVDSDIDGTPDCYDNCPSQPDSIAGVCQCALAFADDDGDGTANCNDLCPLDPLKLAPGPGGCGTPNTDTDGDGTVDYLDFCENDAGKVLPGECGCNVPDTDSDGDGVPDCVDACPLDGGKNLSGICGCGTSDEDADGNYKADCLPFCPPELDTETVFLSRAGLGSTRLSVAGGQYRLCWCAGKELQVNDTNSTNASRYSSCSFPSEYQVDLGGLLILGVAPLQQSWTCVTGLSCIMRDITGYGLSSVDSYAILDTCGVASKPYVAEFSSLDAFRNSSSEAVAASNERWLSENEIVYGGQYRLCWCADWTYHNSTYSHCHQGRDYRVDFGTLQMLGPKFSSVGWTCVSGQTCVAAIETTFSLMNSSLQELDFLVMIHEETCGSEEALFQLARPITPLETGGTTLRAQWDEALLVAGLCWCAARNNSCILDHFRVDLGLYRLCWCSSGYHCSIGEHFRTDFGTLTIVGPSLTQDRTCIAGMTCRTAEDYRVDVGGLFLIGATPIYNGFTCISGLRCELDEDFLIILDTCGAGKAIGPAPKLLGNNSEHASWDVEEMLVLPGGSYKLCWCSAFAEPSGSCVSAEDFLIEVGDLQVLGPALVPQDRTCVSGLTCLFSLSMYGTLAADSLALMDTCGVSLDNLLETFSPSVSVTSFPGNGFNAWSAEVKIGSWAAPGVGMEDYSFDRLLAIPSSGLCGNLEEERYGFSFQNGSQVFKEPGGTYRICWCAGAGDFCMEHPVQVGSLTILGPQPLEQYRTCISGYSCEMDRIQGNMMDEIQGSILIMETCGVITHSFQVPHFDQNLTIKPTLGGGYYRLCWCGDELALANTSSTTVLNTSLTGCQWPDDFLLDVGGSQHFKLHLD
ncbi:unnamed protein product [Durusdinium trenchii]|uniref:Uncharacterized protein n=1 Tax=Durusdinium trenchii TaxID=1381693 RepID=A0ABP0QI95_9DINO